MKYISVLVTCILVLTGCSIKKTDEGKEMGSILVPGMKIEGDSIVLPSFQIAIELSPKAEKKLSDEK